MELSLELDVMQTYMFTTSLTECMVEREHPATDFPGDNTIEEGLDTGEFVDLDTANADIGPLVIMLLSTVNLTTVTEETSVPAPGGVLDNVFSGLGVYVVNPAKVGAFKTLLNQLSEWGKSDAIFAMWMYPKQLVTTTNQEGWASEETILPCGPSYDKNLYIDIPANMGTESAPYVPRNKKLLGYPYSYLYVTNNNGGSAVYHYEQFGSQQAQFRIVGALSPDANICAYPINYKGTTLNFDEGLTLGGFPSCAWAEDTYKLWLAQNQNAHRASAAQNVLSVGVGLGTAAFSVATGNVMGAGAGLATAYHALTQINSLMAQQKDRAIQPYQANGSHSGSVNANAEHQTFTFKKKSVMAERAAILDDYFDLYGYKTLRVKVPAKNHRPHWWYTKTVGCHVVGSASAAEKAKIASIYDNGITFWRDGSQVGNYSLDNRV